MNTYKKHTKTGAFTLVELIVSISILVILSTISYILIQGYMETARDSLRVTDLTNLDKSMKEYLVKNNKLPMISGDTYSIKYIDGNNTLGLWEQGEFGISTISDLDKVDSLPTDPKTKAKYTYSKTSDNQFEIAGTTEVGEKAIIKGNYNKFFVKGDIDNKGIFIFTPSIILSQKGINAGLDSTDNSVSFKETADSGKTNGLKNGLFSNLILNNKKGYPHTYGEKEGEDYFKFTILNNNGFVSLTGKINEKTLKSNIVNITTGFQNTYKDSNIKNLTQYKNIYSITKEEVASMLGINLKSISY